jgi:hypothetical protein
LSSGGTLLGTYVGTIWFLGMNIYDRIK